MRLTLVITTYNWPESLELVLKSVENQTIIPDEVIIADDGSAFETQEFINWFQQDSELNIIHSWQEDIGFRAAKSRNKAIFKSTGDYIILITIRPINIGHELTAEYWLYDLEKVND